MVWDKLKERIEGVVGFDGQQLELGLEVENLKKDLQQNKKILKGILGESNDVIIKNFNLTGDKNKPALLVYIDGLVNTGLLETAVIDPLLHKLKLKDLKNKSNQEKIDMIQESILTSSSTEQQGKLSKIIKLILSGESLLLIDRIDKGLIISSKGWEARAVSEPTTESVVRGPRDGFTENLRTNTAHVRRRLRDPGLRIENHTLGRRSQTDVAILYIDDLTNEHILDEAVKRVTNIEIDGVLESGYVEQFIEDSSFSPFPQIQSTERPDKAVANLLEGRVVIIVDGTPFALIIPAVLDQFYQSPEDYYQRFIVASLTRIIRVVGGLISLALPAFYIAITSFHPEMLPTVFMLSIAGGRAQVPLPAYMEAFLMEVIIEILREASVRLPNLIGSTLGIVGALVIGNAAVNAGLVSPSMVIVVALTTLGSFTTPNYNAAIALRILRYILMVLASSFGLYGLMLGLIGITVHLASLKSFGIPYLTPFAPSRISDLKDSIVRFPLWKMVKRPVLMRTEDPDKKESSQEGDTD
ncbi:spore germination protein, GerA family [Halobacteroides halobius DSM 5150]|uniref:Spore germination protein, GerA family n=1 Tax=Halobacteroides halobius (strain ATCC 35273 / DSM 5150 / MD-1) TaxID=748449 RepID=L0K7F1_HALHC|nr:spore germination protein [Halobacteroides halobius]AGB40048.1 spore germination protein, GerA family [Halobacteroides halobius DSM 5150]